MKYFRMSYEEIVFRRSYINIILLNRSIPSYKTDDDDDNPKQQSGKKKIFSNEDELFMSLM